MFIFEKNQKNIKKPVEYTPTDGIQKINRWINGVALDRGEYQVTLESFMLGDMKDRKNDVKCDLIWKHFVRYYLYWCRQRVVMPSFGSLKYELLGIGRTTRRLDWEGYQLRLMRD